MRLKINTVLISLATEDSSLSSNEGRDSVWGSNFGLPNAAWSNYLQARSEHGRRERSCGLDIRSTTADWIGSTNKMAVQMPLLAPREVEFQNFRSRMLQCYWSGAFCEIAGLCANEGGGNARQETALHGS